MAVQRMAEPSCEPYKYQPASLNEPVLRLPLLGSPESAGADTPMPHEPSAALTWRTPVLPQELFEIVNLALAAGNLPHSLLAPQPPSARSSGLAPIRAITNQRASIRLSQLFISMFLANDKSSARPNRLQRKHRQRNSPKRSRCSRRTQRRSRDTPHRSGLPRCRAYCT